MATGLRALAGPVNVGLAVDDMTSVKRISLLDRGYERTNAPRLQAGAGICRVTQTGAPA
ncbi:hypothetical protein [Pigmentiphaga aceris]|uniref:hypothetical protein n=1 Tax=Pigmentiphaga aceris TaxID=1940612 RepID=UPI001651C04C|nr:hypothetical protein [Pigmentiphaga aceris]